MAVDEKKFLSADDISELIGVSKSMAYTIIRKLNEELAAQGYIIIHGRVSKRYFEEKSYY